MSELSQFFSTRRKIQSSLAGQIQQSEHDVVRNDDDKRRHPGAEQLTGIRADTL